MIYNCISGGDVLFETLLIQQVNSSWTFLRRREVMNSKLRNSFLILLFMIFLGTGCQSEGGGGKEGGKGNYQKVFLATITTELSIQEKDDLLFMWEEEKLAGDVYLTLGSRYGSRVFNNIAVSEQAHMDSIKHLLTQVNLDVPVDETQTGNFQNSDISQLYFDLIQRGSLSLHEAYQVGLDIENLDIEDLSTRINMANDPGVIEVFKKLLSASYKHKSAFERKL